MMILTHNYTLATCILRCAIIAIYIEEVACRVRELEFVWVVNLGYMTLVLTRKQNNILHKFCQNKLKFIVPTH